MIQKNQNNPALICSEIGLVRCLGSAGIPVITGTEVKGNPALYSRYSHERINFSSYESEQFIQELCEFGDKLDYKPLLMSYDDRLLLNISRNRDELLKYYRFLLPKPEMVEGLLDKLKFVELAKKYNLPTPPSVRVRKKGDLKLVSKHLKKPYLLKPLYRHHWFHENFSSIVGSYKKAFVCSTLQELKTLYERIAQINPNVVIQEYIEGPDDHMYDINMYIDDRGNVKGALVAQKLRVYPPTAGYGSYVVTVDDPEILNLSKEIAQKLDLAGLTNIQFKKRKDTGEPILIEIHTRTSIFDILGIKAKMNLPVIYYKDLNGLPLHTNGQYLSGVKYINVGRDLRLFLKNRKTYGLTLPKMAKSYMGPKVIDGFSIKDPLPTAIDIWQKAIKLF
ncbi:MAG: ATP-grasp domain-containing protein [Gracilimonas sp.]|uniref:carboxylate--amine ligase n=1 Tax=Gracilimonas sp. TaxID=1974203 RepID=UPI0019BD8EC9|nr:ATP-grasp domain-containing protein [Gracilimonas sp.]MBD3615447.1 ATP-grasp domain-containing protein [Gracilimonas sp.]